MCAQCGISCTCISDTLRLHWQRNNAWEKGVELKVEESIPPALKIELSKDQLDYIVEAVVKKLQESK